MPGDIGNTCWERTGAMTGGLKLRRTPKHQRASNVRLLAMVKILQVARRHQYDHDTNEGDDQCNPKQVKGSGARQQTSLPMRWLATTALMIKPTTTQPMARVMRRPKQMNTTTTTTTRSTFQSVIKGLSWRAFAAFDTMLVAAVVMYWQTGHVSHALWGMVGGIVSMELVTKTFLYTLHEKLWDGSMTGLGVVMAGWFAPKAMSRDERNALVATKLARMDAAFAAKHGEAAE